MLGSHLSVAGGLHKAVDAAAALGFETVQIFTHAPARWAVARDSEAGVWRAAKLEDAVCEAWRAAVLRAGLKATVVHDSYLINLAAPDDGLWERSIAAFAAELERCHQLGVTYLVSHPGAHQGAGDSNGLQRVVCALDEVHRRTPGVTTLTCLEATAGQGSSLGYRLEHLATLLESVRASHRLAVCLDTAHLFAAGYDLRGRKYVAFRRELERTVGLHHVKVWHLNDSAKPLGSRVDRHAHIGYGFLGVEGFRAVMRDEAWREVPKILETPKADHPSGRPWDAVNREVLLELTGKGLVRRSGGLGSAVAGRHRNPVTTSVSRTSTRLTTGQPAQPSHRTASRG